MLVESKLRNDVIRLVEGKLSLDDFEDCFVAESWNMHQSNSPSAVALASAIELRLAEYSSGHLSEEDMKSELSKLVSGIISVSVNEVAKVASAGSSLSVKNWEWQQTAQPVGISLEAAHVS